MAKQYYLGNIKGPAGDIGAAGLPGPQGIKGNVGAQGSKGDKGEQGLHGSKGDTGPQGDQGIKGDKGDAGATGADGVTYDWLTGTTAPTAATGKQGDMYINTSTQDVYKKTSATIWTLQCNIKGTIGTTGVKGDAGLQGPQGVKGDTGATGSKGDKGDTGSTGANGTTYDWLIGTTIPSVATGKQGDMYLNTVTQDVYKKISSTIWTLQCNIKGAIGVTGSKGDKGDTGANGADGVTYDWLTGTTAPTAATGKQGDMYINTITQDIYKKTNATVWILQCNIKGATGTIGLKGDTGPQGPQGDIGIQGPKGDTGERGPIGGGSGATITIAPYNAMEKSKEKADIVLSGDTTDSIKINDAILQLSIGGEIRFFEGTIKCYSIINLGNNITISGLGNCTIFQKYFNGILFSASENEYIKIKDFKIDANSFNNYNISFSQVSDIRIKNILIFNAENGIIVNNSDSILFLESKLITNDFCVRISNSNNIRIEKCHYSSLSSSVIFSDSSACKQIFINGSTLISTLYEPIYWRRVHYGGIQNCYLENTSGNTSGSMLQCTYNIISNNILKALDNDFSLTSGNHNICIGNIGSFSNMDNNTTIIINNMEI